MAKNAKGDGLKTGRSTGFRFWAFAGFVFNKVLRGAKLSDAEIYDAWCAEFPGRKGHFQPVATGRQYFRQGRPELFTWNDGKPVKGHADLERVEGDAQPDDARDLRPGRGEANMFTCGGPGKGKHAKYVKAGAEKAAKVNVGWESAFANKGKAKKAAKPKGKAAKKAKGKAAAK